MVTVEVMGEATVEAMGEAITAGEMEGVVTGAEVRNPLLSDPAPEYIDIYTGGDF